MLLLVIECIVDSYGFSARLLSIIIIQTFKDSKNLHCLCDRKHYINSLIVLFQMENKDQCLLRYTATATEGKQVLDYLLGSVQ